MSKELSEKIDQTVADLINDEVELSNFVNDYFIQVERVKELEQENKQIKEAYQDRCDDFGHIVITEDNLDEALEQGLVKKREENNESR